MRSRITHARAAAVPIAVALSCLIFLAACAEEAAVPFSGTRRTPSPLIESTMPTDDGGDFAFVADEDNVLLVYFGFTFCPDVCPTTLADISFARNELGDRSELVDLAMVTIDPDRDTEEVLTNYLNSFVPGAAALRTDDDAILRSAADEFGVFYQVEALESGDVDVAHSGTLFAIDDQGRLTASWPFGTPSLDMVNDLEILLSETENNDPSEPT